MDYDLGAEVDPAGKAEDISIEQAQKTESAVAVEEVYVVEDAIAADEAATLPSRKILRPLSPRFEAQH